MIIHGDTFLDRKENEFRLRQKISFLDQHVFSDIKQKMWGFKEMTQTFASYQIEMKKMGEELDLAPYPIKQAN